MWEDITHDWVNHKAYIRLAEKAKNVAYKKFEDYQEVMTTHFGITYRIGWNEGKIYFVERWRN